MEKPLDSTSLGGLEQPLEKQKDMRPHRALGDLAAQFAALSQTERTFVQTAVKLGDYQAAAEKVRHANPYNLLARKRVRAILLRLAPFTQHAAALAKPYVLAALQKKACEGDSNAAKTLLALAPSQKSPKPPEY